MGKALRTALSLVVSLVLLSTLTMAQPAGKKANKDQKEHHSRFAKMAFWRHHKDADKKSKSHSSNKHAHAKSAQTKPASAKQVVKKDQKPEHASKAPAANKTKQQKTQDPKTAS
ncbi:MAG: hypothetical protein DMG70_21920 [Acidobacteria bacterium]|nr:MAG: hypothetical protein DMG70_21920 [Acidobacteriota bacterium]PYY08648.1 MAG: hypothetical protein DMG69_14175 [Acidobacteriota bacterium]